MLPFQSTGCGDGPGSRSTWDDARYRHASLDQQCCLDMVCGMIGVASTSQKPRIIATNIKAYKLVESRF